MRGALKQAREVSAGLGEREQAEEGPGKMFACFRKSLPHAHGWKFPPPPHHENSGKAAGVGLGEGKACVFCLETFLR